MHPLSLADITSPAPARNNQRVIRHDKYARGQRLLTRLARWARTLVASALALILPLETALAGCGILRNEQPGLIRDAEIEQLLRIYTFPIFRAAGLSPGAVKFHIISAGSINAFVANGQRIFLHTGLLLAAKDPNVVIGVLAHETGHIAGGHLTRLQRQLEKAQTVAIIGSLLGAAAAIGGAVAGANTGSAAGGLMAGANSIALRSLMSYQRAQEAAADQAAIKYLNATKQSARGMIVLFEELATQALGSLDRVDPYVLSHPLPRDRIALLEQLAKGSPYFNKKDSAGLKARHKMMQAKLHGFLEHSQIVMRRYPTSDTTPPARYARAIAHSCNGNIDAALREVAVLEKIMPSNPFLWELKGQMLLESSRVAQSIAPLSRAVKLAPRSGLIRILLAKALIATENEKNVDAAIKHLFKAQHTEGRSVELYRQWALAYGRKGDFAKADLSAADAAFYAGKYKLAKEFARRAKRRLAKNSRGWLRANRIIRFKPRNKKS